MRGQLGEDVVVDHQVDRLEEDVARRLLDSLDPKRQMARCHFQPQRKLLLPADNLGRPLERFGVNA